ncbi:MAG: primosomal protein N', partial [Hyphomonadaceae bacterium]|nr:primosomal protein N' [Hyphomonadaceae bacterium]
MPMQIASILFTVPLPEPFDYAVPEGMMMEEGSIVRAPLGATLRTGVVWALKAGDAYPRERLDKLKPIAEVRPAPPLRAPLRGLIDWAARYLVTAQGNLLAMVLRSREALEEGPFESLLQASATPPAKLTAQRAAVLEAAHQPIRRADLSATTGASAAVISGLIKVGALDVMQVPVDQPFATPDPHHAPAGLSPDQAAAADMITDAVATHSFAPVLLDGVTGSGKTEVYLEAVARTLAAEPDAQVLIMLPEIALSQAVLSRIEARFGARPVEWHSDVQSAARRRAWREIAAGRARIVIGARSALFLPYANLRLIVVDEEHDGSYKQDEGLHYHARDLAVVRAKFEQACVVLASATPSLETAINAGQGRYQRIVLPARYGVATLPEVELIDMKVHRPEPDHWISPPLRAAMADTLARGEQSLLFLNRRGFAPVVLCRACGHKMKAPDTDSWLVEHRYARRLVCHLTGYSIPKPDRCPQCGTIGGLTSVGPGVERIAVEAAETFPQARVAVLSSDTVQGPAALRAMIEAMEKGEIDILIGTQIVAKGHNFPGLTLVGVVDADLGLQGGDPRAGERTFQLLSQVAGRAGRADRPGRAMIQTHYPEAEALQALVRGDRDGFIHAEQQGRMAMGLPPYGRMASLVIQGQDPAKLDEVVRAAGQAAPHVAGVNVWGPAAPPLSVLRG